MAYAAGAEGAHFYLTPQRTQRAVYSGIMVEGNMSNAVTPGIAPPGSTATFARGLKGLLDLAGKFGSTLDKTGIDEGIHRRGPFAA